MNKIYKKNICLFLVFVLIGVSLQSSLTSKAAAPYAELIYATQEFTCVEADKDAEVYYSFGNKSYDIKASVDMGGDERTIDTHFSSGQPPTYTKVNPGTGNLFFDIPYYWDTRSDKIVYVKVIKDDFVKYFTVELHKSVKYKAKYVAKASNVSPLFNDKSDFGYVLIYLPNGTLWDGTLWDKNYKDEITRLNSNQWNYADCFSDTNFQYSLGNMLPLLASTTGGELHLSLYSGSYPVAIASIGDESIDYYCGAYATVKIPRQASAPKIKVDMGNISYSTTAKQEYRIKIIVPPATADTATFSDWKDTTKKMSLYSMAGMENALKSNTALPAIQLNIRTKATSKKICSKTYLIDIPAQTVVDSDKIKFQGSVKEKSGIQMQVIDCNKDLKPYEYILEAPTTETKWKRVTKATLVTIKGLSEGSTLYIREAGIRENVKKGIQLKFPSTYATYKVVSSTMVKQ